MLKKVAIAAGVTAGVMVAAANLLYDALLVPASPLSVRRFFERDAVAASRPMDTTGLGPDAQAWQEHRARALEWLDAGTFEELTLRAPERDAVAASRPMDTTGLGPDAQAWQEHRARALEWLDAGTFEELTLRAPEGPVLCGRLYPADLPTHRCAVLCHGYVGSPGNLAGTALRFHDEGWNVLMPWMRGHGQSEGKSLTVGAKESRDVLGWVRRLVGTALRFHDEGWNVLMPWMRGHGQSEGKSLTVGAKESRDVLGWVRRLVNRDGEAEVLVFGSSMGGASVMQLAGMELPKNVRAIVSDCGFSSLRELMGEEFGPAILPELPLIDATCRLRGGFSIDDVNAVEAVSHASVPMLFIHGAADELVPPAMLDEVYEACASPRKRRLLVPDAPHAQSVTAHPALYWREMDAFIADAWDAA